MYWKSIVPSISALRALGQKVLNKQIDTLGIDWYIHISKITSWWNIQFNFYPDNPSHPYYANIRQATVILPLFYHTSLSGKWSNELQFLSQFFLENASQKPRHFLPIPWPALHGAELTGKGTRRWIQWEGRWWLSGAVWVHHWWRIWKELKTGALSDPPLPVKLNWWRWIPPPLELSTNWLCCEVQLRHMREEWSDGEGRQNLRGGVE